MKPHLIVTQGTFPIAEFCLENELEITLQKNSRTRAVLLDGDTVLLPCFRDVVELIGSPHGFFSNETGGDVVYHQISNRSSTFHKRGNLFFNDNDKGEVIEDGSDLTFKLTSLFGISTVSLVVGNIFRLYVNGFPVLDDFKRDYFGVGESISNDATTSRFLDSARAAMWYGHFNSAKNNSLRALKLDEPCSEAHILAAFAEYKLNGNKNSKFINWHLFRALRLDPTYQKSVDFFKNRYLS